MPACRSLARPPSPQDYSLGGGQFCFVNVTELGAEPAIGPVGGGTRVLARGDGLVPDRCHSDTAREPKRCQWQRAPPPGAEAGSGPTVLVAASVDHARGAIVCYSPSMPDDWPAGEPLSLQASLERSPLDCIWMPPDCPECPRTAPGLPLGAPLDRLAGCPNIALDHHLCGLPLAGEPQRVRLPRDYHVQVRAAAYPPSDTSYRHYSPPAAPGVIPTARPSSLPFTAQPPLLAMHRYEPLPPLPTLSPGTGPVLGGTVLSLYGASMRQVGRTLIASV